jgi:hypothetical protein
MSALPPKADIVQHDRNVCFVPKADSRTAACNNRAAARITNPSAKTGKAIAGSDSPARAAIDWEFR